ncbi:alkylation response protein AidB-like acyl-CoA dehydrogenase [Glutamicibacter mysorens]|uniref:Alkylation response protein AidB-like acyl-CoA dehydrogenase n=1 Tax=Glutamicibacter mysorens TaxID=257984 RepID=A0ABX4N0K5_9MICC|nr:acyl-CoA dehydrogenase family protein [Glutamicibacter mysorens]PJJ45181.1 alkylation response protein AidB-like acyl-CoA dehydrogenase [Glutamicibacter mysorens]
MVKTLEKVPEKTWDSVLAELAERREEFHELGYIPRDYIDSLKEIGIYRASAPQQFGGEPMPPAEFLKIIEKVARVDGSAGWVVAFGTALTYLGSLPLSTQAEIYKDGPDVVYAGGLYPMQPATRTATGFKVSGHWKFASGCMGADWIGVGLVDSNGENKPRAALVPFDQVEIVKDWDVNGMHATGSFDTVLKDVDIPYEWTFVRGGASNIDEPLYRYPLLGYQAQAHSAVALGVARAALDFVHESGAYTGITGAPPLADRPYFRLQYSKAYAALHSARSFYYDVAEQVWETVTRGDTVTDEQKALVRLSATNMADVASQVVHDLVMISGSKIINKSHPMNLLRLDAPVPQLHALLSQSTYDAAGAVLMNQPSTLPGFL